MEQIIQSYEDKGYYLAKSVFTDEFCMYLKKQLSSMASKIDIPYSDVPWGYGNLVDTPPFNDIVKDKFIVDFCMNLFKDKYIFNHLMINNKASWIGSAVEFHQEIFNVDSYAPGYSKDDWKNFMQIYIALDEHTVENGCLVVIPESHKLGVLSHEDIVGDNLGHKRRVTHKAMHSAYETCGKMTVLMKPGDILFFSHKLVHGSGTNVSETDRKSVVLQVRRDIKNKDDDIFEKETLYRRNYTITQLSKKIDDIKSKNMYKDFKK